MSSTHPPSSDVYDAIVVGAGNAGSSAASTAAETLRSLNPSPTSEPRILLIEKSPRETSGGNTFYTAGAYRFTFDSFSDLRPISSHNGQRGLPDDLASKIEMAPYTAADFHADLDRLTSGRADPALAEVLISQSRNAVDWMAGNGGQWELSFYRQAYEVDGKYEFWGGLVVCFAGGGTGLVKWHEGLADRLGVEVRYDTAVVDLVSTRSDTSSRVTGVITECPSDASRQRQTIMSRGGVVLASGGFQASPTLHTQHLGFEWSTAHVRRSPTNTGDMHTLLLPKQQQHHIQNHNPISSPRQIHPSNRRLPQRLLGPLLPPERRLTHAHKPIHQIRVSAGDHGEHVGPTDASSTKAPTCATTRTPSSGREVLRQPGGVAWQIWDSRGAEFLRKEEHDASVTRLITDVSLEGLAGQLVDDGMCDRDGFLGTVTRFNEACEAFGRERPDVEFDPAARDGLSTQSQAVKLEIPKSNWALGLTKSPFVAVKITCGVTFTFGGLKVLPGTAEVVVDDDGGDAARGGEEVPIEGLYCCGELMGGLFWNNYPGGSGLTAGTVFGRIAGRHAANRAVRVRKSEE